MNQADHNEATMRRRPRQGRGQQRVETILDAAEQLYAEIGYEAATTNEIAARASTAIGSLYQFFPNKEAILHALVERYRAGFAALIENPVEQSAADQTLAGQIARLVDAMIAYGGEHPGLIRVVLQPGAAPAIAGAARPLFDELTQRIEAVLEQYVPHLNAERRSLAAEVGITTAMALLSLAIGEKIAGHYDRMFALLGQVRTILVAYFTAVAREENN